MRRVADRPCRFNTARGEPGAPCGYLPLRYGSTARRTPWGCPMNTMNMLLMAPPLGDGAAPRFFVRVRRLARPPAPWRWAIHEKGRADPCRCSTRSYRCADEAWAVGRAMLDRVGPPAHIQTTAPGP